MHPSFQSGARLAAAERRLRRLGYTRMQPYGCAGISGLYAGFRVHFYNVDAVKREAARARGILAKARR